MPKTKLIIASPLLLVALLGGGYYWWTQERSVESTDNAYVDSDISHISVKVPGYIVKSFVADNQVVRQGQLLAQLEDEQFVARVSQGEARLASARANLQTLTARVELQRALINQAGAGVKAAASDKLRATQQLQRAQKLKVSNYSSQDDVDQLQAGFNSASARLDEARAALVARERELAVLTAQLQQAGSDADEASATLELAKIQLDDTKITAPFAGIIGKRGARVGQYVQPGQALYSLVPDGAVWITANFKETQIQHMRPGQPVQVNLDAFPDRTLTGVIDSLSPASGAKFSLLPAENATGNFTKIVQRVPVRIRLESAGKDQELASVLPGLSAIVRVDTSEANTDAALAARLNH